MIEFRDLYMESFEVLVATGRAGRQLSLGDFKRMLGLVGRNPAASTLDTAYDLGVIEDETVAATVGPVWCGAEFPDRLLPWSKWARLFAVAGYTEDGHVAERPREPLTLYRAAPGPPTRRRFGHTWTEDIETARQFMTTGGRASFAPQLWTAEVDPLRLLARMVGVRAGEVQYVVETKGLEVRPHAVP